MSGKPKYDTCDRCGKPIEGDRRRLVMQREVAAGRFTEGCGFARYYCEGCAERVKRVVRACEMEVWR